jgi:predicted RNA binding protein YcfA (HicA-like mRNA interferase family)
MIKPRRSELLFEVSEDSAGSERPRAGKSPLRILRYREVSQSGNHIILQTETPYHQRVPTPAHKTLKVGTLSAIAKLVAAQKGVTRGDILASIL